MIVNSNGPYVSFLLTVALLCVFVVGCDSSGSSGGEASVDRVAVTGTEVSPNFQSDGKFGVSATPLDGGGNGIISNNLSASVKIEHNPASSTKAHTDSIVAEVDIDSTNEASGNDLAIPIVLDGSGSMGSNDRQRLRVDGAKAFIDALDSGSAPFESAVFEFPGFSSNPDFANTDVFAGFTNDIDSLKNGIEQAEAFGGTPMYSSLAEVLIYSEDERPNANYQKAIVLLADGRPNYSQTLRDSVCTDAQRKNSPIFGIGLGPASDLSDNRDGDAIARMRDISSCSGGAYQGLSPDSLEAVEEAFTSAAAGSSQGSVNFGVEIVSGLSELKAGDIIRGTLTVESGGTSADGVFTFRVPDAATSSSKSFQY